MAMADLQSEPAAPPPSGQRPPWLTSLILVLLPAVALVVVAWWALAWVNGTTAGLRVLLSAAAWAVPSLQATGVSGSLKDGFTLERLVITEPRWSLDAVSLTVTPHDIGWTSRSIDLANVAAQSVIVAWTPSETKAEPEPPASLALPVAVRLRNVAIGELHFGEHGQSPHTVRDIRLQGQADAT